MSQIDIYTLWIVISQQRNETEIQFLLCMIQKAHEKHINEFVVLHVFKQTWRWNYHSTNVSGYRSVIGKWVTITRIRDKFEADWTVQDVLKDRCGTGRNSVDNKSADTVMQVSARTPKKSLRKCSHEICIEKTTNTGGTESSDCTCHQWYSISNNPDGMSLCSTLLLGVYCRRRFTFWACTDLRKFKE